MQPWESVLYLTNRVKGLTAKAQWNEKDKDAVRELLNHVNNRPDSGLDYEAWARRLKEA